MLAAHSSLFSSVLQNINAYQVVAVDFMVHIHFVATSFSSQSMPSINLDGIDPKYFSSIIEFIYTSKLAVTKSNVDQLQLTAQLLQVQDVIDYCAKVKRSQTELGSLHLCHEILL